MINNDKFKNVLIIGSGQSVNKDTLLDLLCESVYRMTELRIKTLNRSISIGEEKQNEVNNEGSYNFKMTTPQTTFTVNNTLNLTCTFDLLIPIDFAGERITEMRIPIIVKTSYNIKN